MSQQAALIGIAVALVFGVGPVGLGLMGLLRSRGATANADSTHAPVLAWRWTLTISSGLLYALAFNVIFFIQELFLVLPKALTPGLRPTLFHNNHTWEGESPLASLFQGTGALAIFITGLVCALVLRRGPGRSTTLRLFLVWMTYNGFFQSLPQVVVGALNPRNDVGMAMDYLGLSVTARSVAALVALAAMPAIAMWLRRPLLSLADDVARIATGRARTRFVFQVATLPALTAILLIIPFRIPREFIEVVLVPVVVTVIGIAWIQATAWRATQTATAGGLRPASIAVPLAALIVLLLVFQLLLRPGIHFY